MDKDIFIIMVVGMCFISVSTILPLSIMYLRRGEKKKAQKELPVADIIARLERMEVDMESMSSEIERIGEGQRFTTRLLNESGQRALANADAPTRRD